ncbi:MAG: dipeptidase [Pedosphaera sp.]|nr:dipeptidase [Pedosphaera sp.]
MQPVESYLEANHDRFVRELCEYLRFPSISAQPQHRDDIFACARWLTKHFESMGLEATLRPTPGNPVVIAKTHRASGCRKPHYLIYGHYDVQPPEPFDLWLSQPFEARIEGSRLYARGACDNKGPSFVHFKAVEAYLKTGTELPCDITFVMEGEEEVGSEHLAAFLEENRQELQCDGIVISDTGLVSPKHPTLSYGLRGIAAMEITLHGPSRDLHSGLFGGSLDNPAMALCQLLAQLRDQKGRVAIPGFYKSVAALTKYEREQANRLPFGPAAYRKFLGVPKLFGEEGFTPHEQRSARPTLEINGLTSGYQGDGSKTIIPAWGRAKITMRLVPNQKPSQILKLVEKHLRSICPPTVRMEISLGHSGEAYMISPESPQVQTALSALRKSFGREPVLVREGGSIPIVNAFKRILKTDVLLLGLSLPDDNAHSPNEKFDLDVFAKGLRMSACLWPELAALHGASSTPQKLRSRRS